MGRFLLISTYSRLATAAAALIVAGVLAGCQTDGPLPLRAQQPISPQLLALMERKAMTKDGAMLIRIFKEESELEVWKESTNGQMALLKTYPICRWSGELGPKIKEGDRQAPEGFYTITPGQMNPNSSLYLSFNLGFPNAFDRAHGRTGSHLMVHGDCTSSGCYAMTDEQITEIFALGREAFFAGQKSFQLQAFPFRMTAKNMARHRANPNMPFWRMLKEGYDHFEVTHVEPKVAVCEKRYVFNPRAPLNSAAALSFNPTARCPAYEVPEEIASAVAAKQQTDEAKVAELVKNGISPAPVRTNSDGGMHNVFLAKVRPGRFRNPDGSDQMSLFPSPAPGTIPEHVNPPKEAAPVWAGEMTASVSENAGGVSQARTNPAARSMLASPKQPPPASRVDGPAKASAQQTSEAVKVTASRGAAKAEAAVVQVQSGGVEGTMSGAQPVVPAGTFDNRWSSFR